MPIKVLAPIIFDGPRLRCLLIKHFRGIKLRQFFVKFFYFKADVIINEDYETNLKLKD